jgi:hypothetical protein
VGSPILGLTLKTTGPCSPKLLPLRPTRSLPMTHRHAQSPVGHAPQACEASDPHTRMISALSGHAPKACQASNPQAFTISAGRCPSGLHRTRQSLPGSTPKACTGRHGFCWAGNPQACKISAGNAPLRSVKLVIHRHAQSPLGWAHALQAHQAHAPKAH